MNLLAFDTSSKNLGTALLAGNEKYESLISAGLKHSEQLMEEVIALLNKASIKASDLDGVACMRGPGSFTGLRIGMAAAKGIALGAEIPLFSIPSLDVLAYGYDVFELPVLPVIDAKKGRFYTSIYVSGKPLIPVSDIPAEEAVLLLKKNGFEKTLVTGPDSPFFISSINDPFSTTLIQDPFYHTGKAWVLLELASAVMRESRADGESQGPVYLRKSEAEITFGL